MTDASQDEIDAITAALARLRGRRPRGPWNAPGRDREADDPRRGRGGPSMHGHAGAHPGPPWGASPPPWAMGAASGRFAGPARMRMLEALAAASGPLTVSEIGASVGVDQPRASRLVQQSVELGLVRREADPDDARRTRIVLTDAGTALVRGFHGDRREAIAAALASFTPEERAELARLLTRFAEAWPRD